MENTEKARRGKVRQDKTIQSEAKTRQNKTKQDKTDEDKDKAINAVVQQTQREKKKRRGNPPNKTRNTVRYAKKNDRWVRARVCEGRHGWVAFRSARGTLILSHEPGAGAGWRIDDQSK